MVKKYKYLNIDNWNNLYDSKLFKNTKDYLKNNVFFLYGQPTLLEEETQKIIYDALEKEDIIIIEGATGKGKSRYLPHMLYNYIKNVKNIPDPKIIITEPRRSTVLNPYNTAMKDTGMDKKYEAIETKPSETPVFFDYNDFKKQNKNKYTEFFKSMILKYEKSEKEKM